MMMDDFKMLLKKIVAGDRKNVVFIPQPYLVDHWTEPEKRRYIIQYLQMIGNPDGKGH